MRTSMEESFRGLNGQTGSKDEPMSIYDIYLQAQGLQQTAANAIKVDQGGSRPQSIVRDAAQRLIAAATQLHGPAPKLGRSRVYPEMTWTEVFALAKAVGDWADQHRNQQTSQEHLKDTPVTVKRGG